MGFFKQKKMIYPEYRWRAHNFAKYKDNDYPYFLIIEEVGEFIGKIAKFKRGDYEFTDEMRTLILKELGDICWGLNEVMIQRAGFLYAQKKPKKYLLSKLVFWTALIFIFRKSRFGIVRNFTQRAYNVINAIALTYQSNINLIFIMNIDKLKSRQQRNKINGSGDNR